jgi:hypothetical protein
MTFPVYVFWRVLKGFGALLFAPVALVLLPFVILAAVALDWWCAVEVDWKRIKEKSES